MAAALAVHRAGFDVAIYERYPEVKAAGNILNLWPPPQKVLRLIGVDIADLGAPAHATFRRYDGRLRADVRLPDEVIAEYGGGFIGLLRPGLYKRMLDALPPGVLRTDHTTTAFEQQDDRVIVRFADRTPVEVDVLIGADGLNSVVRRGLDVALRRLRRRDVDRGRLLPRRRARGRRRARRHSGPARAAGLRGAPQAHTRKVTEQA